MQCGPKQSGSLYLTRMQRIRNATAFILVLALKVKIGQKVFYMSSYRVTFQHLFRVIYVIQGAERYEIKEQIICW
jgi:hypothetical protein